MLRSILLINFNCLKYSNNNNNNFIYHFSKRLLSSNNFDHNSSINQSFNEDLFTNEDFTIDEQYFQDEHNQKQILKNIIDREMREDFPKLFSSTSSSSPQELSKHLIEVARSLPNNYHPIWNDRPNNQLNIVEHVGQPRQFDFKPKRAEELLYDMGLAYWSSNSGGKLGMVGGRRSYLFFGQLAKLARALARWTMKKLLHEHNFIPVVTPNLIYSDFVRACGFEPYGERTQVYRLEGRSNVCLSGTAEMPLASMNIGELFSTEKQLPKKYCSLSRCYRAEAKASGEMSGLYRVHYFDKVEMFGITEGGDTGKSDKLLEEFVSIEKSLFKELGLYFRVIDMPPNELGPPAYRKFDIEAYMPGRDFWGEISSASNCTDYQSKRLNITYNHFQFGNENLKQNPEDIIEVKKQYVHTVNGTACAIPRIIISIIEQNQSNLNDHIIIPKVLRPYMNCDYIESNKR